VRPAAGTCTGADGGAESAEEEIAAHEKKIDELDGAIGELQAEVAQENAEFSKHEVWRSLPSPFHLPLNENCRPSSQR
jgi:hypothetical protein